MRCPKCGHSEGDAGFYMHDAAHDKWSFIPYDQDVEFHVSTSMSGDDFDPTVMSGHKPTLWQRLKTWWRAWA